MKYLLAIILCDFVYFCLAQEILNAPESTVAFLDQAAVFMCETNDGTASWRINGTLLDKLPQEIRKNIHNVGSNSATGTRLQNLTIQAVAEYNGTTIQCVVVKSGHFVTSKNVTLKIQGAPSSVSDVKATSTASSVVISWTAPWSLDVTGVDHDIWYSVLIQNVTDEDKPIDIQCTNCTNITETHYTFTPDHLSPCHVFNVSVIPANGAGIGDITSDVTHCIQSCKCQEETSSPKSPETPPELNPRDDMPLAAGISAAVFFIILVVIIVFVIALLPLVSTKRRHSQRSVGSLQESGTEMSIRTPVVSSEGIVQPSPSPRPMTNSKKVNYVREEQKHLLSYSVSASDSPACVHYAAEPEIIPTTEEANLAIAPSSVLPTQHKREEHVDEVVVHYRKDREQLAYPTFPPAVTAAPENTDPGSPTVDAVMFHLKVAAGRWETIADDLGINKELVEEIDSNNETNEACLQGCIEKWVTTLSPSWEKLGRVLEDLGEHSLAEQVYSEGKTGVASHEYRGIRGEPEESKSGIGATELLVGEYTAKHSMVSNEQDLRGSELLTSVENWEKRSAIKPLIAGSVSLLTTSDCYAATEIEEGVHISLPTEHWEEAEAYVIQRDVVPMAGPYPTPKELLHTQGETNGLSDIKTKDTMLPEFYKHETSEDFCQSSKIECKKSSSRSKLTEEVPM